MATPHALRSWEPWEDDVIFDKYATEGARAVGAILGRSKGSVTTRAYKLGASGGDRRARRNDHLPWPLPYHTPEETAANIIFRDWRGPTEPNPAWRIAA